MPLFSMKEELVHRLNELGALGVPAVFLLNFEGDESYVWTREEATQQGVHFALGQIPSDRSVKKTEWIRGIHLVDQGAYEKSFRKVHEHIAQGNSFLVNLTASHPVELGGSLEEIYEAAVAKCKVLWENQWVCFTPEPFVTIDASGVISSFPMKGTAVWKTEKDEKELLQNQKELFEHTTIVDLIRNDISRVADKVWVDRFRFVEKIPTADGRMLMQVSSCIQGKLPLDWKANLGRILAELVPAGSISGAPKPKTVEIIQQAEAALHPMGKRGFYTGIFGYFDGQTVQTFVLIRFIEKTEQGYLFKTGGGITYLSQVQTEYQELASKIYVPIL